MPDTDTAPAARDRIAIVLDTDDLVAAMRLAKAVQPHIANAKVGLELWSAVGPDALAALYPGNEAGQLTSPYISSQKLA